MTDATANNLQRLHDLLSEQATAGLSDSDQLELQKLLHDNATLQREGYELAAAAVDLALAPPNGTPMPESVRRQALLKSTMEAEPEAEIEPVVYNLARDTSTVPRRVVGAKVAISSVDQFPTEPASPPEKPGKMSGLIALAIIGVAFLAYFGGRSGKTKKEATPPTASVTPAATSLCESLKSRADVLVLPWRDQDATVSDASGEVRFSVQSQQGCMTFTGLPRIDGDRVYQLWVLDADRKGPPVDGGIFEVPPGASEFKLAFVPKLKVTRPVVFAITYEEPGGVVQSANKPIIVAKMGS